MSVVRNCSSRPSLAKRTSTCTKKKESNNPKKKRLKKKKIDASTMLRSKIRHVLTHHVETVCMWSLRSSKKRRLCEAASGPRPPGGLYTSQCPLIIVLALSLAWRWEDGLDGWRDKILGGRGNEGTEVGMLSPYALSEIAAGLGMGAESDPPIQSGLIWPWQKWPSVPVRPCVHPVPPPSDPALPSFLSPLRPCNPSPVFLVWEFHVAF